ncbi:TTAGGG repeat binding factor [Exophiala xenobiotica]|uniref:TTAGGG repeat binding factor n=1 Tax=Lithohypha guttulata TaxID=1690604 RepID=A0ABR0KNJ6_9EURO|nr:TTAGGG repeat binding factor [Lithohypha guttulata]KAK5315663.1 TTAGGG repeat binding factor [Exophiala xenobiotica]
MPRSARRKSTPTSPARSREASAPPRQIRRSTRTQSREPNNATTRNTTRQQPQLEPVNEQDDTIVVHDASNSGQATAADGSHGSEDAAIRSESAESLVSSSNGSLPGVDHEVVIDNVVSINQDADDLLSQFRRLSIEQIAGALLDPGSSSYKRIHNAALRLRRSTEPCGKVHMLPLRALSQVFADHALQPSGLCLVFMKANLARLLLALFNLKLADNDLSGTDSLHHLTSIEPFPQPFMMQSEPALSNHDLERKTMSLGISILTQLYICTSTERIGADDFDPDLLLQQIFNDEDGKLRNLSFSNGIHEEDSNVRKRIERRMHDIRKFISRNRSQPLHLEALRQKYSRKAFLEQTLAWTSERAKQLNEAIEIEGGALAIRDLLQAGPQSVTPKPVRSEQETRWEREEKALEEGTAFLRAMDEELDAAEEEESEGQDEEAIEADEEVEQHQEQDEAQDAIAAERENRKTISESPQANEDPPQLQREQADEADAQLQSEAANANGNDEEINQNVPDSAQPPPDWMSRPTQETLNVLNVTQRQAKESNKENSPPRRRYGLLDRQPGARKVNWDDTDSPPPDTSQSKRPRTNDDGSEEEDEFERDPRQAKRPRPANDKAVTISTRTRGNASGSDMFVNDSDEQEEQNRAPSRTSPQPVSQRPAPSNTRAVPSSTQPLPPHAAAATASSSARHQSPSFPASAPPPSSYEAYEATRRQAQTNSRFATLVASTATFRPPQVRRPWSAEELKRLIELMKQFGTSWAKIKQADDRMAVPQLTDRSQVQLKDKARNMKLDFLKAEQPLPEFIENVTISRGHKEQLRARGLGVPGEEDEE